MASIFGKINVLGLGSGLDLQGLLDQLREIEEKPIERLEQKKDRYESKLTEFDWLNTQIISLKSKALELSFESTFMERQVSVSGTAVSVEAEIGALNGAYQISVEQLAHKSMWQSQGFSEQNASVASNDDVFQIAVGDKSFSVLVSKGTTLQGLADLINKAEDNPGVEAKVVNTGDPNNPYRLILKAKETGEGHRIVVTQELSQMSFEEVSGIPNIWRTNFYSNPEDVVNNSGSTINLTIQNGEEEISIEIPDSTTLSELVDLINEASSKNSYLRAYLIRNTNGEYFVDIRSPESLFISQSPSTPQIFPKQIEDNGQSLNSFFILDDIRYQRETNSINDIIPGATINLKETGSAFFEIQSSYEEPKEILKSFIEEVNNFLGKLREKMSFDLETGEEGLLYRSSAAESMIKDIRTILTSIVSQNKHIKTFFDLGLDIKKDGSIALNEKKLEEAFNNYPEEIKNLLVGNEKQNLTGLADRLNEIFQKYLGPSGLIALEQKTTEKYIENLNRNISLAKLRVDRYMDTLMRQFMALDHYIQELNDLSSYLDVQFKSLSGLTEKK